MAPYINDLTINGVPCRLTINGAQVEIYTVKITLCDDKWFPHTEGLTMLSPELLAEAAGIAKRNKWTTAGPFDPVFRRNLLETLEHNYRRETLPSDSDPEELDVIMRKLVDHYVEPMVKGLAEAGFPKDAEPVFRQFAREDFAFSIGLTVGQFWEGVKKEG